MTRREWLYLSSVALAGCKDDQSKPAPASPQTKSDSDRLKAGPFAVTVPQDWLATAIVEKVPLRPLYSAERWQAYKKNDHHG